MGIKHSSDAVPPPNHAPVHRSTKVIIIFLDGEIRPGSTLVLPTDVARDLIVLGLLNCRLVVLLALTHELLLHEINACESISTDFVNCGSP